LDDKHKVTLILNKADHALAVNCDGPSINWAIAAIRQAIHQVSYRYPIYKHDDVDALHTIKIELHFNTVTHRVWPESDGCPSEAWYLAILEQALEALNQESRMAFAMLKQAQAIEQAKYSGLISDLRGN
jgi:hypothetical protein